MFTVFARSGDDFVRSTTSLKKADGERVMGTLLDHNHAGDALLLDGKSYTGPAKLFGNDDVTQYDPVKDSAGKAIGATFVALNVTNYMTELKASIQSLKIASTGYLYVVDSRPGNDNGTMLVHPSLTGKNVLSQTDTNGREIFKEMLAKKKGLFTVCQLLSERVFRSSTHHQVTSSIPRTTWYASTTTASSTQSGDRRNPARSGCFCRWAASR